MGAFTKWAKIAAAAGSVALLSVETVMLESSKAVESTRQRESEEQTKLAAAEEKKKALQLQQEAKAAAARSRPCSRAPKMAPQFDGLNFYETFISSAQR